MSSKEYDVLIRKAGQIHEYELNKSFGTRDYFRYYKKTYKDGITEQLYSKILKEVITAMIDELKEDRYAVFPFAIGFLKTNYFDYAVKFVDGKVKVYSAIDWYSTIKLWHEDEEARERKQLVYKDKLRLKRAVYSKTGVSFKNKCYLCLDIKRSVHRELTENYNNKNKIKPIIYG